MSTINTLGPSSLESLFAPETQGTPYRFSWITGEWLYDSGKSQMAVAGPDLTNGQKTPCVIVNLHAPVSQLIVRFMMTRLGAQPVAPSPNPSDPNLVLKTAKVTPMAPVLSADARGYVYGITGEYLFYCLVPVNPAEGLPGIAQPYQKGTKYDFPFPPGQFSQYLF